MSHFDPKISVAEENYLKVIYKESLRHPEKVSTNSIAEALDMKAASVTDMIQKLSAKQFVEYEKYKGVSLTAEGKQIAVYLVRKHRLWEVFLESKLGFHWDEVHEIAEQLEHTHSPELIKRLDKFLDYPKYDPHGDPIPDESGNMFSREGVPLSTIDEGQSVCLQSVLNMTTDLFQWMQDVGLQLQTVIKVVKKYNFDQSYLVETNQGKSITISGVLSNLLYVSLPE